MNPVTGIPSFNLLTNAEKIGVLKMRTLYTGTLPLGVVGPSCLLPGNASCSRACKLPNTASVNQACSNQDSPVLDCCSNQVLLSDSMQVLAMQAAGVLIGVQPRSDRACHSVWFEALIVGSAATKYWHAEQRDVRGKQNKLKKQLSNS